jgi:MFS superfamily sulfate permease-like transporter
MLSGIGILIVASQSHVLLDAIPKARGLENFAALPAAAWESVTGAAEGQAPAALLIGMGTIAIMLFWEKLRPAKLRFVPGALLAVVAMTLTAQLGGFDVKRVDVPANLFAAVSLPSMGSLFGIFDSSLLIAAVTFAFIASAETLLSAAAVDRMHNGVRTNYDRELTAQGVGNMICGVLGALPMTGVIVRSAANVQAGSATRMAAIMHGGWLLAFVMLLPWLMRMTPVSCLAGILVYTGVKMVNPKQIKDLAAYGKGTAAVYVATTVAIVATDLLTGVIVGFGLSLFRLALLSSKMRMDVEHHDEPGKATLHMEGSATFLKVPSMARTLATVPPNTRLSVVMDRLQHVDQASLELLREWGQNASKRGCELVVDWQELNRRVEGSRQAA